MSFCRYRQSLPPCLHTKMKCLQLLLHLKLFCRVLSAALLFSSSSFGADLLSSFSTDAANFASDLTYSKSRFKGALGTAAENSTNITTPQKISDDINYISAGYNFAAATTNDGKVIL